MEPVLKAYFDSCPSCPKGVIEHKGTVSSLIDACRARWGEGNLIRVKSTGEYIWRKDENADFIGCCAVRVYGEE